MKHIVFDNFDAPLTKRERKAIAYHYIDGYTLIETAFLLDVSVRTVSRLCKSGREKIRQTYETK